jgi:hypothetical protein
MNLYKYSGIKIGIFKALIERISLMIKLENNMFHN